MDLLLDLLLLLEGLFLGVEAAHPKNKNVNMRVKIKGIKISYSLIV
jgi:hypothetical protein